jgi:hypothetical protein
MQICNESPRSLQLPAAEFIQPSKSLLETSSANNVRPSELKGGSTVEDKHLMEKSGSKGKWNMR